jgi:hypothetical protein
MAKTSMLLWPYRSQYPKSCSTHKHVHDFASVHPSLHSNSSLLRLAEKGNEQIWVLQKNHTREVKRWTIPLDEDSQLHYIHNPSGKVPKP